jgi:hypothetical protein
MNLLTALNTLPRHVSRTLDAWFRPRGLFQELAETQDLGPAWTSLAITTLLFSLTSLLARGHGIPLTAEPLLAWPDYRLWQTLIMPALLTSGWGLCAATAWLLGRLLLRNQTGFIALLAVSAPALFTPQWLTWPMELAWSLGLIPAGAPGFQGMWMRHLAPAFTFVYMLALLWIAWWQACRLLLREAFALAVLSLLPCLWLWSLLLR